jgi:hypothetical protein
VAILASILDLPEPHKWNQLFNVGENFTHEAVNKKKELSQAMSIEEEINATVHQENNGIEKNMLELERPVHHIEVSYDMGWQVRSSSGSYASPTGHGMLIGALKKRC